MKKLLLASFAALMLSFGLFFSNSPLFTPTAEAKAQQIVYSIHLTPGGTYQLGSGTGYKYVILQGDFKKLTVSSKGLVTATTSPITDDDGFVGDIYVIDKYGNSLEFVHVYIN
ncbi:hypothetical protein A3842_02890 [Paenibacillus sp. P3E]|uniref:hypothetical protein n=1 Tax=Paenibacillus sp. P3E TaxID=1349435 RepID=UPI00093A6944|nr:hypothetical protein [Paenibacillus sp. P3E]OKP91510.1 hypothetical protein A3842_02890 [Paenibacillus sp. P3E]